MARDASGPRFARAGKHTVLAFTAQAAEGHEVAVLDLEEVTAAPAVVASR